MVKITIMMEGGVLEHENVDVATVDNTESLRQSLHRIFSELLGEEISIVIQMGAGYRFAASRFAQSSENNVFLYVDLDDTKDKIPDWFCKLATENPDKPILISEEKRLNVFFMIQEMEAWILKQPQAIELWGEKNSYIRTDLNPVAQHSLIAGKNIEDITKPSKKLADIIKHFFSKAYNGKKTKIKYGKLKTAPGLLDCLETARLKENDAEMSRFCQIMLIGTKLFFVPRLKKK